MVLSGAKQAEAPLSDSSEAPPPAGRMPKVVEGEEPQKGKKEKKSSLSTLTAWQILAEQVINSRDATSAAAEAAASADPTGLPPHLTCEGLENAGAEKYYEVLNELGRGAFGRCVKARKRSDGTLACIKLINSSIAEEVEVKMALEEVRTLRKLHHPNIVQILGAYHSSNAIAIAMELCPGGDLERWIKSRRGLYLSEPTIMLCFVQLCLALQHVHDQGIMHRDIKTSNIFLTGPNLDYVKLGDFGIAKTLAPGQSCASTMLGTPYYFSPELISDQPYSRKSDVWAAGCVLYELCSLKMPFQGNSVSSVCVKILSATIPPLPTAPGYSNHLLELVNLVLTKDPKRRPNINTVLSIPYVQHYVKVYESMRAVREMLPLAAAAAGAVEEGPDEEKEAVTVARKGSSDVEPKEFPRMVNLPLPSRRLADYECQEELEEGDGVQFHFAS